MPRIAHQPAPTAPGPGPTQNPRIPNPTYPKHIPPPPKPVPRVKISSGPPTTIPPSSHTPLTPSPRLTCTICARKSKSSSSSKYKSPPPPCPHSPASDSGSTISSAPPSTPPPLHATEHWRDFYRPPRLPDVQLLPKPPDGIRVYSTKWKRDNPNLKTREGLQAYYGGMGMPMGMSGMYPGVGMGMGMMPGMLGMGGMGMPMMGGMYPGMMGGYGMPRYGGMYGGMGYPGYAIMDPYQYAAHPSVNFVDDFPDAHRIEHAYRQSAPDSYGLGMGAMAGGLGGGMGINNLPGSQVLLYGRGMGYGVGF